MRPPQILLESSSRMVRLMKRPNLDRLVTKCKTASQQVAHKYKSVTCRVSLKARRKSCENKSTSPTQMSSSTMSVDSQLAVALDETTHSTEYAPSAVNNRMKVASAQTETSSMDESSLDSASGRSSTASREMLINALSLTPSRPRTPDNSDETSTRSLEQVSPISRGDLSSVTASSRLTSPSESFGCVVQTSSMSRDVEKETKSCLVRPVEDAGLTAEGHEEQIRVRDEVTPLQE